MKTMKICKSGWMEEWVRNQPRAEMEKVAATEKRADDTPEFSSMFHEAIDRLKEKEGVGA